MKQGWHEQGRRDDPQKAGLFMATRSGNLPFMQLPADAGAVTTVRRILDFIKERRLVDFHAYRPGTIQRMLALRVAKCDAEDLDAYYKILLSSPTEVDELIQALTVKVSAFFRNPLAFEALGTAVLPELSERFPDEALRVWCAGCARGEEAYSVAILLREMAPRTRAKPFVLGTDLDSAAIDAARRAQYPEEALLDVKKRHLDIYFRADAGTWTVGREIRSLVTFAPHDITTLHVPRGGVFNDYHLILCRNLLIYLGRDLGERVVSFLARSLVRGGFLMLGEAEAVPEALEPTFSEILPELKIYRKNIARAAR